jgi:uncharacterized protein (TIGR03435 family)
MTTRLTTVAILIACTTTPAFGQPAPTRPAFEVATIKPNTSGELGAGVTMLPGGRFTAKNATLKTLIAMSYRVKSDLITGGPPWLETARFDVIAKAPPNAPVPTLLLMVQTMLEDQFELTFHRQDKVMSAYALVIGKQGSTLRPAADGGRESCSSQAKDVGGVPMIHRVCHHTTMAELARQLSLGNFGMPTDRPVVDATQLVGAYDFEFEYRRPRPAEGQGEGSASGALPAAADLSPPTIFDALLPLGLQLETSKQPVPVIVVDHAERPRE